MLDYVGLNNESVEIEGISGMRMVDRPRVKRRTWTLYMIFPPLMVGDLDVMRTKVRRPMPYVLTTRLRGDLFCMLQKVGDVGGFTVVCAE